MKLLAREKGIEPLIFSFGDCCLTYWATLLYWSWISDSNRGGQSRRLTRPFQSTTMGIQHFMVGNVGLEPLFLTPNQVCYHYTTFPKLNTANKEDLLNLLAGATAYHVCQPLINNFYSRARWLVRTILHRKPISKTPKTLSF